MKIDEASIDHNAVRLIKDLVGGSYDMIMANGETDYQFAEERAYMMMTLGEVQGIIDMAEAMKEVVEGVTNEEAVKELYEWLDGCCGGEEIEPTREALRMAIEALRNKNDLPISPLLKEQKQPKNGSEQVGDAEMLGDRTADNCISRQAAIDAVKHAWAKGLEPSQYIEDLPSVQPELIEKAAYIRGFEQGRTQGMIASQGGEK